MFQFKSSQTATVSHKEGILIRLVLESLMILQKRRPLPLV